MAFARNGDTAKGEDAAKIYLYRNIRASSITNITNDYVNTASNPTNEEAKVAESLSLQTTNLTFNKFVMLEDDNDPNVKIPTIFTKDTTDQCIALQAADYLSPAINPADPTYIPRGFTTLTQLREGEGCE